METLRALKAALDPDNLCNPGKVVPTKESGLTHYWPNLENGPDSR
jgi:hypothetical protein